MVATFYEIRPDNPNNNPAELATLLNTQLLALGPIGILDLQLETRDLFNNPLLVFTLVAEDPGPLQFNATYFSEDQGTPTDLDTQYNNFFAADTSRRAFYIFDVSSQLRRYSNNDAIIVVYAASTASNFNSDQERALVVQATENIGTNNLGSARIVSSAGLQDTITIRNRSGFTWTSGDRGYASISNTDADLWDGYQICCNAP